MSCTLQTSKWSQTLWRGHLAHAQSARTLVRTGERLQPAFAGVADDIHGLLYLLHTPPAVPDAPTWATDLLAQAQELAEWKPLKSRCRANGFAAGLATECLLRGLIGLTPQATPDPQAPPTASQTASGAHGSPDEGATRRTLRQALRAAGTQVDTATSALEGISEVLGIHAGQQPGREDTLVELEQVRALWEQLARDDLLQMIAQMAGRLARLAQRAKRTQGPSTLGSVTGITRGGDLSKILPEELVGLRGGRLARLQVLGKIASRKALQYATTSAVPASRGPLLVLLDKSGSMGMPRTRLAWSKAVALALLTLCREQRRTWACVSFDARVSREIVVEDGRVTDQDALLQALLEDAGGETEFDPPLRRALALLTERPALKEADIIMVTDGKSTVSAEVEAAVRARMAQDGLSCYVIGIGSKADLSPFTPFATTCYRLSSDPQASEGTIAPLLAQLA